LVPLFLFFTHLWKGRNIHARSDAFDALLLPASKALKKKGMPIAASMKRFSLLAIKIKGFKKLTECRKKKSVDIKMNLMLFFFIDKKCWQEALLDRYA
jgi:hypothetical protein